MKLQFNYNEKLLITLIQCEFCGKVCTLTRSDKKTCSNNCSVKLISARKRSFRTPLEQFLQMPVETINHKISVNDEVIIDDSESITALESAKERLIEFNDLQKTNTDGSSIN